MDLNRIIGFYAVDKLSRGFELVDVEDRSHDVRVLTNVEWPEHGGGLLRCIECEQPFQVGDRITLVSVREEHEIGTISLALHDYHRMRVADAAYIQYSTS